MARIIAKPIPPAPANTPANFTLADAEALHAIHEGRAEPEQQQRALKWIIEQAAMTYTWAYRDVPRESDIALGRQFVGQQIVGLLNTKLSDLRRRENEIA